ncbi:unnamed protein product [Arabidopsis thaliana]|uniref:(thale cress) hypothetical protein n=1 Tax=Arabidopsis thaliana TaxID=3702 RepID=A0A7G2FIY2_ARATH|nr:unnamed protein product [Arabidopsis thaliana]
MGASNHDNDFNSTTNWKLVDGTLIDAISFESSFTANPESDDGIISAAVDHVKSPLLLLPPVPNGEPCEITITFAQEHELRQIYIRSSARVYEVYYTKKRRHDKEYLCTVRCGVAIRDEEVLQIPLTESADSKPVKDLIERKVADNVNGRTSEDDWVEVKASDDSLLNNEKQDFYEATAEINDAEPCTSITVRLLSLQDKRCALVDEVYVFADPVDPSESEKEEATGTGNSSSSSLMAMFMPALLQLSRGKERDRQVSDKSNSTNPVAIGNTDQIGVSSPVDTVAKPVDAATRVSGAEIKPALSCNNVETILNQLVNKLVEKKLEQLGKKSFESDLGFRTKIPNQDSLRSDTDKTPDTDESDGLTKNTDVVPDSSSIDNSEDCAVVLPKNRLDNILSKSVELESENSSISGNEMISAEPEIRNEEVGHSFEEKPKHSLSINDALASALAGLLSSHSITDGKYSQALVITAPEFSSEDDVEIEEKPGTSAHPDDSQVAAEESENRYSSSLESSTSAQKEPGITPDDSHGTMYGVFKKLDDSFGGDEEAETVVSVSDNALDEETVTSSTKADCYTERENLSYKPTEPDSLIHELECSNVTTAKCKGEPSMDDVLKSVLGFQPTTSSVDFLTPVLDVKFNLENKDSDSKYFFEVLFTEESKTYVDCKNDVFDDNLVSVEDEEELKGPPTDTLSSVEMNHYATNEMPIHWNGEISEASLI